MTVTLADIVRVATATTGTGTLTLGSAVTGFKAPPAALDGKTVTYCIEEPGTAPTSREIGRGVYTASGTTLTRATVLASTNSDAKINLTSGGSHVFITAAAEDIYRGTPTCTRLTTGSGTYTLKAGCIGIRVRMCGPGGGGGAANTNAGGSSSTDTSFESWTAIHGNGGSTSNGNGGAGGTGGANGTGTLVDRTPGTDGQLGVSVAISGPGGNAPFFGGGAAATVSSLGGFSAKTNTGGGGAGGADGAHTGGGGGGGEYVEFTMTAAQVGAGVSYVVGTKGSGGAAGGKVGGDGADGIIIIDEHY